jgi:uncharacterized protein (DUF849 family)
VNAEVILTCAITGDGDTVDKHPAIPVTPKQIADAAIEAAAAGASAVHIHVRDPDTGKPSRSIKLYREVVERIRDAFPETVINLTAGVGGKLVLDTADPTQAAAGSDIEDAAGRFDHIEELKPDICSLDCGSFNTGGDEELYVSTQGMLRQMARRAQVLGVKPELECFDLGHVQFANALVTEGLIGSPPLYQFALGVKWTAPADIHTMIAMRSMVPADAVWAAFGISRMEMPIVAQSVLLGGNARVGLEDNLYLKRGVHASNAQLVEKAVRIISDLGARVLSPMETRKKLNLRHVVHA